MKAIVYSNSESFNVTSAVSALTRAWNLRESHKVIYTYSDEEHTVLTLDKLAQGPNEIEHVLSEVPEELEAPKVGSHLGMFLEEDGLVQVSRLYHVSNFFSKVFAGRELMILMQARPTFEHKSHRRFIVAFADLCEVFEDGTYKSQGQMKRERPVQAKIGFARNPDQVNSILDQVACLTNTMRLPTPVSFKMYGDCVIAHTGSPLDDTWSSQVVVPTDDALRVPTVTVYLARTGSYARTDLGFTTIFDGRINKRFTEYNRTRQPHTLGVIDIIAQPIATNEVYLNYLGAGLIGESVSDFYDRKEDFFSCSEESRS